MPCLYLTLFQHTLIRVVYHKCVYNRLCLPNKDQVRIGMNEGLKSLQSVAQ